jgi:hypothetical protein
MPAASRAARTGTTVAEIEHTAPAAIVTSSWLHTTRTPPTVCLYRSS